MWTDEWAGARVLLVFVARAPGWLAEPLLRREVPWGGPLCRTGTSEPAMGCALLLHTPYPLPGKFFPSAFQASRPFMLKVSVGCPSMPLGYICSGSSALPFAHVLNHRAQRNISIGRQEVVKLRVILA